MAKLVKCKICGNKIAKSAKTCPHCGSKNRKTVSPVFAILVFLFCCAMIGGIARNADSSPKKEIQNTHDTKKTEEEPTAEELLAFDDASWPAFMALYRSHQNLMDAMQKYSDGELDSLGFYDYCEEAKEYFSKVSLTFYGKEKDYQNEYLSPFLSMATSDQAAADLLLKYIDKPKANYLSDAKKNIEKATEAITVIASNRGVLLAQAGLSDSEIREKVEKDTID